MTQPQAELTAAEKLVAFADKHGLTLETVFIPYSQSENSKPSPARGGKAWRSLNWRIRVMRKDSTGAAVCLLETTYSAGVAHTKAYGLPDTSPLLKQAPYAPRRAREELIAWEIEKGGQGRWSAVRDQITTNPGTPSYRPELADVLASLALDASVLDEASFEDWAASLSYDADSRAAESIYRTCLETALKLRAAFGDEGLRELRDAAADY